MLDPLAILTCAAIVVYAIAARSFAVAIGVETTRPRITTCASIVLAAAAAAAFVLGAVSYAGLYLGIWAATIVAFALIGGPSMRSLLAANTAALCFMLAGSLLLFGYLCIVDPDESSLLVRRMLVAGALVLAAAYLMALARIFRGAYPQSKRGDQALKPFSTFAYFAILYELLDLAPSQSDMEFAFLPYILLGGTLLITLACGTFAFVATRLGNEALRESENRALERKRKDQETRLRLYLAQASTDGLTGLATRRIGDERLEILESENAPYTLAFIDIDGLKKINDEHGHLQGDNYLVACAEVFRTAFPSSLVVRWGGDEFLIIDEDMSETKLKARLSTLEEQGGFQTVPLRFSFGVAAGSSATAVEALRRADEAMYAAKRGKRATKDGAL